VRLKSPQIAKVKVSGSDAIFLDGKSVTLEQLDQSFTELAAASGVVWYHRDDPAQKPPPVGTDVIKKVIFHRLPIKLCEKDFDVDPDCRSVVKGSH
jgi:hypothetical protein